MSLATKIATSVLTNILERPQVHDVAMEAAPTVAAQVVEAVKASPDIAIVPVKPIWRSRIVWTQVAAAVVAIGAVFGFDLNQEQLQAAIVGVPAIVAIITTVLRYFSRSVTAAAGRK